jgi:CBS domain containing-hemolysin-like protein
MTGVLIASLLLLFGSAFFVAAEYSLVSSRRSRFEALARQGNRRAAVIAKELGRLSHYVAGIQIAITMLGIGVGSVTEPYLTQLLRSAFPSANRSLTYAISFLGLSFLLVVVGELVPKYATLRRPERTAMALFGPLRFFSTLLTPLIWIAQTVAGGVLALLGLRREEHAEEAMPKEELLLLVQTGGVHGVLDKRHADLVARALRLDVLTARDIMVHRLDIRWLDLDSDREAVLSALRDIPYSRIPVCRGDIDDLVGVVHVHDIVKRLAEPEFKLADLLVEPVIIPENLTLERVIQTMRSQKSHLLVVADEYGGTEGMVTLEDVVEEVFGDLEDRAESERPNLTLFRSGRVVARADVRFDELARFLELPDDRADQTDSLATLIVDSLERVPTLGDRVQTELGLLRVDNMARQRITWVSVSLKPEILAKVPAHVFTDPRRR